MLVSKRKAAIAVVVSGTAAVVLWFLRERRKRHYGDASFDGFGVDFEAGQSDAVDSDGHSRYIHQRQSHTRIRSRSRNFLSLCEKRRSIRFFSSDPVPKDVIENIVSAACTAPSGAHKQPWTFVAVQDMNAKKKIRELVEKEEALNYERRMRKSWVKDVANMVSGLHSTDNVSKPYLTDAPWLIVVFKQTHGVDPRTNERIDHYYVQESVGIACGMLVVAIQNANLVTLTSTPMGADKGIRTLLGRPDNEKVFLLMPVGFPASDATVPYREPQRRPLNQSLHWV